ncbi:MAG: type II toxin-antitoxin system HigB family toxin [Flavobacteriales bacterium]|nr:type II toxin-antitoxin system HigB family toxin [Flavobacteriales bacterium]
MRIIAKRTLRDFWSKHADCEQQLKAWFRDTERASWRNLNELKIDHPNASIVRSGRVIFNIKGNKYRSIVKFNFDYQLCWVRFLGTHAEYDRVDPNTI